MLQDYMCSDCGLEYPTHDEEPSKCPACKCEKKVKIVIPSTDGAMHGSWENTTWDQPNLD